MIASPIPATKEPRRGSSTLFLRYVHPAVRREALELARTRGWTLSQLVARLLDLREAALDLADQENAAVGDALLALRLGRHP